MEIRKSILAFVAGVAFLTPAWGSPSATERRNEAEQEAEYAKLLNLLEQRQAPVKQIAGEFDVSGQPTLGAPDAPVVLIEFGSFACPYCERHAARTMPRLLEHIERGEILYVFSDFAATEEGRNMASAGLCAAEQGAYRAFREVVLSSRGVSSPEIFDDHARAAGVDLISFHRCVQQGRHVASIDRTAKTARALNIRGTPTFLLGTPAGAAGRVKLARRIDGARPYVTFARAIAELLELK